MLKRCDNKDINCNNLLLLFSVILVASTTISFPEASAIATGQLPNTTQATIMSTSNTSATATDFERAKQQYLSAWNMTDFHSGFDTFVSEVPIGYGVYVDRGSNVFEPGEGITLYVEPIGFAYKPVFDEKGNRVYLMNLTVDASISDKQGKELQKMENVVDSKIISNRKNTEIYLAPVLNPAPPLVEGEYIITLIITDGETQRSFNIAKNIKVGEIFTPGSG